MHLGYPPFTEASSNDQFYKMIAANRSDLFWKTHQKFADENDNPISEEFKDLISSMMQLEPLHRPSMNEIWAHPWVMGDTLTEPEIKQHFKVR